MMGRVRVWVTYKPYLYHEIIVFVLRSLDGVEVVGSLSEDVDVIVFPTDEAGQPEVEFLPALVPPAKLVAVSLAGQGWVRLADESLWQRFRLADLNDLCVEVAAGRGRPNTPPGNASPRSRVELVFQTVSPALVQPWRRDAFPIRWRPVFGQKAPRWFILNAAVIAIGLFTLIALAVSVWG
jgi:hypothetical protein